MAMTSDLYQSITDSIVQTMESDIGSFALPWRKTEAPKNAVTGKSYRGINVPILWIKAASMGYSSPLWATYKQWQDIGANVRKGEKSTVITFWKSFQNNDDQTQMVMRSYLVFNAAQVEGFTPPEPVVKGKNEVIENAQNFFDSVKMILTHEGDRAYYRPTTDAVVMPDMDKFDDSVSYYAVLAHEVIHWTGSAKRLDRKLNNGRFGDEAYAFEELVAELGSAFLCAYLGLTNEPRVDHARYLKSWLKVLKNDKKAIFTAASQAQKAVDFLVGNQDSED